jgi:type I restriction enzyme S subunit
MTQERRIVGRAARVPPLDSPLGVMSMDLVRISTRAEHPLSWVYSTLRYSAFADEVKQHANGVNVLHLSPDSIREYRLPVPPAARAKDFARLVEPLFQAQDAFESRTGTLRATRDLLLPRLLSGQLSVDDAA